MRKKAAPYKHAKTTEERIERRRKTAREYARRWRREHPGVAAEKRRRWLATRPGYERQLREANPDAYVLRKAKQCMDWFNQKTAAIAALGGKCARCGITDPRVLQIDHVSGGGSQERRSPGFRLPRLYKAIAELGGQGRFQCL